ncbi:phosphonate ABC transporter ATP-binding protein [Oceanicella sp. SM1341]|uniref:phosphonate ABC transporter ATP-binding protein n=1 Tax=Oceanicella sp. SM1341 TaxID=1548889 RepID=UPI000E539FF4|nr:phosphonate ABC transporter ATP-binding protein [Oceanicella sp. SM1341]
MDLTITGLTKRFGTAVAVDDVTLTFERPQMIGVIGRSGAGKSTLLRMLNRLTGASEGSVRADGTDVLALRGRALRRWRRDCAMIFQQFNLVPRLDVLTNVLMGRLNDHSAASAILRLFSREERLEALAALDRLGIAGHAMKRAEALSGGQQQRVAIARALMQDPKLILADEPIASLDPLNAKVVMDALRAIHEEDGRMVICNLHTLDTARAYCDRIVGMRDGRVVFDGLPAQLTEGAARDIYGAGDEFTEAATSTSIETLGRQPLREAKALAE